MFTPLLQLKNVSGKDLKISYPCVVLNVMVAQHNTNPQFATLTDPATKKYATSAEMSIEFEVDGPYKARTFGTLARVLRHLSAPALRSQPVLAELRAVAHISSKSALQSVRTPWYGTGLPRTSMLSSRALSDPKRCL